MAAVDTSAVPFNSDTSSSVLAGVAMAGMGAAVRGPEQMRDALLKKLDDRRNHIDIYDAYYRGKHPLAFASQKFKAAFGNLFGAFADNWCPIVVDAVDERLSVEGFRLGDNTEGDKDAWAIWQANNLDAMSQVAHTEALIAGESYVLVAPDDDDDGEGVEITIEHASQMWVERSASGDRDVIAAVKKWVDDDGYLMVTLYMPDFVYKWRSERAQSDSTSNTKWVARQPDGETWPIVNPLGEVPIVPLENNSRLLTCGCSELVGVIPVQDAVNKLVADMLLASEFSAFRQRWVTGMEIPVDPVTNAPIEPFKAAVDRTFMAEDPNARFGEFGEATLSNYVAAIEMLVQHVASQSRTPPHYFYLSGQFPSGESIKSAEAGLVAKTRRKMRHFGEAWEEVIRLAFKVKGDAKGKIADSETIWGDPEYRTEGEHVDAVLKMRALGVPQHKLWQLLGFSPTEIGQFDAMLDEEAKRAARFAASDLGVSPTGKDGAPKGSQIEPGAVDASQTTAGMPAMGLPAPVPPPG